MHKIRIHMKNFLKKLIHVREWDQSSKTAAILFMAVVLVYIVLSIINISESEMMENASVTVKEMIEA